MTRMEFIEFEITFLVVVMTCLIIVWVEWFIGMR